MTSLEAHMETAFITIANLLDEDAIACAPLSAASSSASILGDSTAQPMGEANGLEIDRDYLNTLFYGHRAVFNTSNLSSGDLAVRVQAQHAFMEHEAGAVERLFDSSRRSQVLGVRGEDAIQLLEVFQTWLACSSTSHRHRTRAQHLLVKLAATSEELPPSLYVPVDGLTFDDPSAILGGGGFAMVYKATQQERLVAVKVLYHSWNVTHEKRLKLCREALIWQHLNHRFVLPFIGLCHPVYGYHLLPYMVSVRAEHGTLRDYVKSPMFDPSSDPLRLFSETTEGIGYLHLHSIVHGDLNYKNILIGYEGQVQLADFGLMRLDDHTDADWTASNETSLTGNWASPQRIDGARRCREDDVFALGCVGYVVHSGCAPFSHLKTDFAVSMAVYQGQRPDKPLPQSGEPLPVEPRADMWALIERCWHQNEDMRPETKEILQCLHSMTPPSERARAILESHRRVSRHDDSASSDLDLLGEQWRYLEQIHELSDEALRALLEAASWFLERVPIADLHGRHVLMLSTKIAERLDTLPSSLQITGGLSFSSSDVHFASVSTPSIRIGRLGSVRVCVTVLPYMGDARATRQIIRRDALAWSQLRHERILPLLGVYADRSHPFPGFVTPFMSHGTLQRAAPSFMSFIRRTRLEKITEVAEGIQYLHSQSIIHGDIRPVNVLIDDGGHARLTGILFDDLGESAGAAPTTTPFTRYTSPQLLESGARVTRSDDMWAYSMTAYEVATGLAPLHSERNEFRAMRYMLQGTRPSWPTPPLPEPADVVIGIVERTWLQDARQRPSVDEVLVVLRKLARYPDDREGGRLTARRIRRVDEQDGERSEHTDD